MSPECSPRTYAVDPNMHSCVPGWKWLGEDNALCYSEERPKGSVVHVLFPSTPHSRRKPTSPEENPQGFLLQTSTFCFGRWLHWTKCLQINKVRERSSRHAGTNVTVFRVVLQIAISRLDKKFMGTVSSEKLGGWGVERKWLNFFFCVLAILC